MADMKVYTGGPLTVVAKKSMSRGGRAWTAGVHTFSTKDELAELGDTKTIAAMVATMQIYPADFDVSFGDKK